MQAHTTPSHSCGQTPTTPSRCACHPSLKRRGEIFFFPSCPRRGRCVGGRKRGPSMLGI